MELYLAAFNKGILLANQGSSINSWILTEEDRRELNLLTVSRREEIEKDKREKQQSTKCYFPDLELDFIRHSDSYKQSNYSLISPEFIGAFIGEIRDSKKYQRLRNQDKEDFISDTLFQLTLILNKAMNDEQILQELDFSMLVAKCVSRAYAKYCQYRNQKRNNPEDHTGDNYYFPEELDGLMDQDGNPVDFITEDNLYNNATRRKPKVDPEAQLVSIPEAARLLKLSVDWIYKLIREHRIKKHGIRRKYKVDLREVKMVTGV